MRGHEDEITQQPNENEHESRVKISFDHFSSQHPQADLQLRKTLSARSAQSHHNDNLDHDTFDFSSILKEQISSKNENGIETRDLGVSFKNLTVKGTDSKTSFHQNFGSLFSPRTWKHNFSDLLRPQTKHILYDFKGVVKPGEMLLVLGVPGSGCSTFLKTLVNHTTDYKSVSGNISYDGISPETLAKHYKGDAVYCPEDDVHFPTLTVEQTLDFAARCRAPHSRLPNESRDDNTKFLVDTLLTLFGLNHVRNTVVGNAAIRGVSGGQKKRVSIAENMVLRSCINAWDNSTRGLDSSTSLEFVQALRIATDINRLSTIAAFYQASENIYNLFDKVCVISEGRMAYFGPASKARQYFVDLGFQPANRQTTPDFLLAATGAQSRIIRSGYENIFPRSSQDLAEHFLKSQVSSDLDKEIEEYESKFAGDCGKEESFRKSALAEKARRMRKSSPYTISIPMQIREVIHRRVLMIKGDLGFQAIVLSSFIFQALVCGSIFYNLSSDTSDFFSRGGVLFFGLFFPCINALSELPALYEQRPIVMRHAKAAMYHPFVDSIALTLVDAVIFVVVIACFTLILYFLPNLTTTAGQFFIYFLFIYQNALTMKSFFRSVASVFATEQPANCCSGIFMSLLILYTGYIIPIPDIIGGLRWISWLNPLRYSFEAIITNEFHSIHGQCTDLIPNGPGYENVSLANQVCTTVGSLPGQSVVSGDNFLFESYNYSHSHVWRNYGVLWAFTAGYTLFLFFSTEMRSKLAASSAKLLFRYRSNPLNEDPTIDIEKRTTDEVVIDSTSDVNEANGTAVNSISSGVDCQINKKDFSRPIFSFTNINYSVKFSKQRTEQFLSDVSGYVVPGQLTALMGESGAGKTTLLNTLAERLSTGIVTGDRFVNGQQLPKDFRGQTGYCQQTDTHVGNTTVKEAVYFSAYMRQPASVPESEKKAYARHVLKMCSMESYADAMVKTLGVEHSKRLTIAVELAAKPALLLFLDEPTSGLDAQSAISLVRFLRQLANDGQAILCTIHQPSAELFQEFDKLLLLRKGGQTCYFGDLGYNASKLITYFETNGGRKIEPGENPAEWMLDVIGAGATATTDIDWHDVWNRSPDNDALQSELEEIHNDGRQKPIMEGRNKGEFSMPWILQLKGLLARHFKVYWRDSTYLVSKIILFIISGLFIGFTFFKADNSIQGAQNKIFSVFISTLLAIPTAQGLMSPFCDFRDVFSIREGPSGMYSWTALVTSGLITEIPFNMASSITFFFTYFWTVGFSNDRAGYTFFFISIIYPLYYISLGQAVVSLTPDAITGALVFSVVCAFIVLFNGVMQPYRALGWWKWMYRVSPLTYITEGLSGNIVGHTEIRCSDTEFVTVEPPNDSTCQDYLEAFMESSGGYISNPDSTHGCQYCQYSTSDKYLKSSFNIVYEHRWRNLGIFIVFIVVNIVVVYFFTWIRTGGAKRLFKRK